MSRVGEPSTPRHRARRPHDRAARAFFALVAVAVAVAVHTLPGIGEVRER